MIEPRTQDCWDGVDLERALAEALSDVPVYPHRCVLPRRDGLPGAVWDCDCGQRWWLTVWRHWIAVPAGK